MLNAGKVALPLATLCESSMLHDAGRRRAIVGSMHLKMLVTYFYWEVKHSRSTLSNTQGPVERDPK